MSMPFELFVSIFYFAVFSVRIQEKHVGTCRKRSTQKVLSFVLFECKRGWKKTCNTVVMAR